MNSENLIAEILIPSSEISNNLIKGTSFTDPETELEFKDNWINDSPMKNYLFNLVIFLGYISIAPYVIFFDYQLAILIVFLVMLCLSIATFSIAFYFRKHKKSFFYNNHIQIFLISGFLLAKGYIIIGYYRDQMDDSLKELLRIIIYHFIATGILLLLAIESNFIYGIYFLLNLSLVITAELTSKKKITFLWKELQAFSFLQYYIW